MIKNRLIDKAGTTLEEVLRLLDENGNGFLPVVDDDGRLTGIITDGDIRKALLQKKYRVEEIINRRPKTMLETASRAQIINELKRVYRRQMPVVDAENRLVDIVEFDRIDFNLKENRVVIMAGGLGSRLGELTKHTPKPMLSVGPKPMLEHLIEKFSGFGFLNFYLSVNYKSDVIKNHFDDGKRLGVNIKYLEEEKRLGTAGALFMLDPGELKEPFFVINGDIMTDLDFSKLLRFHLEQESDATMCVRTLDMQIPYGVINSDQDRLLSIEEKPHQSYQINAGIYMLSPDVLRFVPRNMFYDMPTLFETLIDQRFNVCTYSIDSYWIDIGRVQDYERANKDMYEN